PVAVSSAICWSVPLMSVVFVVVMDWTLMGAPPPTSTLPTRIFRVGRRGARVGAGAAGIPRLTVMAPRLLMTPDEPRHRGRSEQADGADDVGEDEHDAAQQQERPHPVGDGQQLGGV